MSADVPGVFMAAFGLGLVFNAAPGPVFAATLRFGARGGFWPALRVQLGSLAGDAVWALIGLSGVSFLTQLESLRVPVGIAGAVYLLWLAWDAWQASRAALIDTDAPAVPDRRRGMLPPLGAGVLLSLTNPQNIGYWAALGSSVAAVAGGAADEHTYVIFFSGFMASSMVWAVVCAALVQTVFGRAGVHWARVTYGVCAILFLALALASLRQLWDSQAESSWTIPVLSTGSSAS